MIFKNPKKLTGQEAMLRLNAELMGKYSNDGQQRAHAPKRLSGSEAMKRLNKELGISQSAEEFRQEAEERRISQAVEAGVKKALQSQAASSKIQTPSTVLEALNNWKPATQASSTATHKPAPTAAALSNKRLVDMSKEELAQISPQEFVARWERGETQAHSSKACHSGQGPVMQATIVSGQEALQRLNSLNLL